jgi:branched-chain amino acid transport system substrate-binding protein
MYGRAMLRLGALKALSAAAIASAFLAHPMPVLADDTIKIGHLTDMNTSYADAAGKWGYAAEQMAIEDFGGSVLGRKIELLLADHQLKPSVGSSIATEWFDRDNVQAITGLTGSSVALAVQEIVRKRPDKAVVFTVPQSSDISGKFCAANSVHWSADFYPLGTSVTRFAAEKLGKKNFLMVLDTAAGAPARVAAEIGVKNGGGEIVGTVRIPEQTADVSSYVLQAQASGANNLIIGFAGSTFVNVVKTAREFGMIGQGMNIIAFGLLNVDVQAMGLDVAADVVFSTPFYYAVNDQAKLFSKRFYERTGRYPGYTHVADYEAMTHYLKGVRKAGTTNGTNVAAAMRDIPVEGFALQNARIRADNHLVRDIFIGRVKSPKQSTGPEDYMSLLGVVAADDAYRPLAESECPLVKK